MHSFNFTTIIHRVSHKTNDDALSKQIYLQYTKTYFVKCSMLDLAADVDVAVVEPDMIAANSFVDLQQADSFAEADMSYDCP